MTRRRPWRALAIAVGLLGALRPLAAAAQSVRLVVTPSYGDSISPAPTMSISAVESQPDLGPYTVELALSLDADFGTLFYARAATSENVIFTIDSLMPQGVTVYFRAQLLDRLGAVVAEQRQSHPVRSWVRLVSPVRASNDVLFTRAPTFVWSSPGISLPPGLFLYDLTVFNTAAGSPEASFGGLTDTSFTVPAASALQACTSYSWQVEAHASSGTGHGVVIAKSPGTFVLQTPDCPTATIFYQNFPNPFGAGTRSASTCFWFDLANTSKVELTIYDIRLHRVRDIAARTFGSTPLAPGAYGRQGDPTLGGCDPRLQWDGRDDSGRFVPPGIYKAVFDGDGVHTSKTILYKGP